MTRLTAGRQKFIAGALLLVLTMLVACLLFVKTEGTMVITVAPLPDNYTESEDDYEQYVEYASTETFRSINEFSEVTLDQFESVDTFESVTVEVDNSCRELILLSDDEAWQLISDGVFSSYPTGSYSQHKNELKTIYDNKLVVIHVPVWFWAYPEDKTNMFKSTSTLNIAVNEELAELFINIFNDIYRDPSCPVINLKDAGMGTWVLRGKNHNNNSSISGHALGTTIDINPSTGSFNVNGQWYGNGYGHKAMSKSMWDQLPECHEKYQVIYKDCPIVQVFKSYGFVWGGDWTNGTDCMHFSFLGDGKNERVKGQENYYKYN